MNQTTPKPIRLAAQPGHLIRRLQQIAVAAFLDEVPHLGITPIQFAVLQAVADNPNIDQRSVAAQVGIDTSTIGGVVDRLEVRDLIRRGSSSSDRRVRLLSLTANGRKTLAAAVPCMLRAQQRILEPLSKGEQVQFMVLLTRMVMSNNTLSRAPEADK